MMASIDSVPKPTPITDPFITLRKVAHYRVVTHCSPITVTDVQNYSPTEMGRTRELELQGLNRPVHVSAITSALRTSIPRSIGIVSTHHRLHIALHAPLAISKSSSTIFLMTTAQDAQFQ